MPLSTFAHYAVAGERSVVKVRRDVPLKLLGPLGCSIQTGAGTVMKGLRPQPGSSMLVQGIRGFVEGNSVPDYFIPRLIDLYTQGRFPSTSSCGLYTFEEISRAVEDQRNGIVTKPILEVSVA